MAAEGFAKRDREALKMVVRSMVGKYVCVWGSE